MARRRKRPPAILPDHWQQSSLCAISDCAVSAAALVACIAFLPIVLALGWCSTEPLEEG